MSEPAIKTEPQRIIGRDKDMFLAEENPFEAMMERFDHAAQLLNLDPGLYKVLRNPEKQIIVSVPIIRDNGEVEVYTGYRVLYNRSEEHTSELQSQSNLVCRLLLEKKKKNKIKKQIM